MLKNNKLKTIPFFLLLLPLFIIAHMEHLYGTLYSFYDVKWQLAFLILVPIFLFLAIKFIFVKSIVKSSLIAFLISFFIFFYTDIKLFIFSVNPDSLFGRYTILVPLLGLIITILCIFIIKSFSNFYKTFQFLHLSILLMFCYDLFFVIKYKFFNPQVAIQAKPLELKKNKTKMPDIYYLVFDEYTSSKEIKEAMYFDNSEIDSFLYKKGFYNIINSKCNYNRTPFSIGSSLNMDYYPSIKESGIYSLKNYTQAIKYIQKNKLIKTVEKSNYKIFNLSIFNFENYPKKFDKMDIWDIKNIYNYYNFFVKANIDLTLGIRILNIFNNESASPEIRDANIIQTTNAVIDICKKQDTLPKFIYGHFILPHDPYTKDSLGNTIDFKEPKSIKEEYTSYFYQVKYANKIIKQMVDSIQKYNKNEFAIIIQGDHGLRLRNFKDVTQNKIVASSHEFPNFNSIYFSDGDYSGIPNNFTNVNTFRFVLNHYFKEQSSILENKQFFMGYKD